MVEGVRRDDEGRVKLACIVGQQAGQVGLVGRGRQPGFLEEPGEVSAYAAGDGSQTTGMAGRSGSGSIRRR